jgi:hypothetical protein
MKCDICAEYIYANDWFPKNDFKICKQCFEGSDKSAPNNKRFINHFDPSNSMSNIEDQMKANVKDRATIKAYHDLNDINIENLENPTSTIMLHKMIQELLESANLTDQDSITLFKQLTLNAIYVTVENTIESMEKNSIKSFQEEFK